jgi:hypothetical protein
LISGTNKNETVKPQKNKKNRERVSVEGEE